MVRLVSTKDDAVELRPVSSRFVISDLPEFLAAPVLPSMSGFPIVVKLTAGDVAALRQDGQLSLKLGGERIDLTTEFRSQGESLNSGVVLKRAIRNNSLTINEDLNEFRREYEEFGRPVELKIPHRGLADLGMHAESKPPQLAREGLPIAVLLPWKQQWTLTGFSRGNLLSTIALVPGEETTISVSSWERRSKQMQQSAETDIEQTFDFTSTTRDTEDVFREVSSSTDFNAQARGSLDASYSTGVASVRVGIGGELTNAQSLANTVRSSTQHMRETTSRASTRVRARRITTITESIETETTTSVVR
jgi:hypothetical protein